MKPFRTLPVGLAATALAGMALMALPARGSDSARGGLGPHDSNAPVSYGADHIELHDRDNRVLLTGNVDIRQDDTRLTAARGVVAYANGGDGVKIQRLDASGDVTVTRGNENARGDVAVYDFNQRIITMVGNVVLHRASDVLYGGRLVMDLDSGISTVDGRGGAGAPSSSHSGGRVSGSFSVPKKGGKDSGAKP